MQIRGFPVNGVFGQKTMFSEIHCFLTTHTMCEKATYLHLKTTFPGGPIVNWQAQWGAHCKLEAPPSPIPSLPHCPTPAPAPHIYIYIYTYGGGPRFDNAYCLLLILNIYMHWQRQEQRQRQSQRQAETEALTEGETETEAETEAETDTEAETET
jgi:hypothetical protein